MEIFSSNHAFALSQIVLLDCCKEYNFNMCFKADFFISVMEVMLIMWLIFLAASIGSLSFSGVGKQSVGY